MSIPQITPYDVLVRTGSVAISGSDIHIFETGGNTVPDVGLGHDASGIVEEVGARVSNLKPGDRVAIESGLSCGICDYCKCGSYNMCTHLIYNSFLSKYQVHPADLCYKLPTNVSLEEGAMTQTLATGCHACAQAAINPMSNVLVIGSCATAVSAALCARCIGARQVCLCSNNHDTLSYIRKQYNFDYIHYHWSAEAHEVLQCIYSVLQEWPDVVINCAVSEQTMNIAVTALKPCGTCVLTSCEAECAGFNAMDVLMKNVKIIPSFRSTNKFPTALWYMECGKAPMGPLIAKIFSWPDVQDAFQCAQHEANIGNRRVLLNNADEHEHNQEKDEIKS